jgi:hypothetical protein
LAGSVQGVVVQMTADTWRPWRAECVLASVSRSASHRASLTSMDGLVCFSSYSISASASAVRSDMHQWTDFFAL